MDTVVAPDPDAVRWLNPDLVSGEERKVVTGIPGKTGVVYTLDRATGEFLWATPTMAQNVVFDIDGVTGVVSENEDFVFTALGQMPLICPGAIGGRNWEAGAYSPLTNAMYFPMRNVCMPVMATDSPDASLAILGLAVDYTLAPGKDMAGTVYAVSAETGRILWVHEQRASTTSLVATGGGLLFGGDLNGRFKAFDQGTGEVLWEINLGVARDRVSDFLRDRRAAIHRGQYRPLGHLEHAPAPDARVAAERREQPVRVRVAGVITNSTPCRPRSRAERGSSSRYGSLSALRLGGGSAEQRGADALGRVDGDEAARGEQVVLAALVDYAQVPRRGGIVVGDRSVDLV